MIGLHLFARRFLFHQSNTTFVSTNQKRPTPQLGSRSVASTSTSRFENCVMMTRKQKGALKSLLLLLSAKPSNHMGTLSKDDSRQNNNNSSNSDSSPEQNTQLDILTPKNKADTLDRVRKGLHRKISHEGTHCLFMS